MTTETIDLSSTQTTDPSSVQQAAEPGSPHPARCRHHTLRGRQCRLRALDGHNGLGFRHSARNAPQPPATPPTSPRISSMTSPNFPAQTMFANSSRASSSRPLKAAYRPPAPAFPLRRRKGIGQGRGEGAANHLRPPSPQARLRGLCHDRSASPAQVAAFGARCHNFTSYRRLVRRLREKRRLGGSMALRDGWIEKREAMALEGSLRGPGQAGANGTRNVSQMHLARHGGQARQGVITEEMQYVARREKLEPELQLKT